MKTNTVYKLILLEFSECVLVLCIQSPNKA